MDTIPHPLPAAQTVRDLYQAAIGQRNQDYYVAQFEDFDQHGEGMKVSWNWAAFLFTGAWALYRRMYGWFAVWWVVATVIVVFEKSTNAQMHQVIGIAVLALALGFGAFADGLYHRSVLARIAAAQKRARDSDRVAKRLHASGGVHAWVPIAFGGIPALGLVAALVLPAYKGYRMQAATAPMALETPSGELPASSSHSQPTPNSSLKSSVESTFSYEDAKLEAGDAARKRGDYAKALRTYLILASKGDSRAQFTLGWMHAGGEGVAQDDADAVRWYRLAAAQGNMAAVTNLGVMYEQGRGTLQDHAEAAKWYRQAASQGVAAAQFNLASLYANGEGVAQDYQQAARWYRLAAAQGHASAQTNLGTMYGNGQGMARDDLRAHMWFNLGAAAGNPYAIQHREAIAATMTQQQIALAQQMARACQQRNFSGCE